MKKFIIALICIGSLGACKDFLEEKQVSSLTQDFYNTETGLDALIKGLYLYSRVKHEWDANGARLIEPETDAYMTVNAQYATATATAYGSNVSNIAGNMTNYIGAPNTNTTAPMGAYPHINNCNIALDLLDNIKPGKFGTDANYNAQRKGEVLFLRAWAYYLISNQLGDVPLLLKPKYEDNGVYYYPKSSLTEIYQRIIADLRVAYDALPLTQAEQGRVTKAAAGHLLAKLYLNRAQAAPFQNNGAQHLARLYKGTSATDLDSAIHYSSEVITAMGNAAGLAPDYWTLFDPKVAETTPHKEILWAAQFSTNISLNGRFGGNRSINYHIGDYTNGTGVTRAMAYGRPFGTFKPTDWAYDNFRDKVNDSRYYKTFSYEYVSNMPLATSTSFTWSAAAAAYWNANKPASEPTVAANAKRILPEKRALIYLENQQSEALDSARVRNLPYQFMVRWVRSAKTGRYYYRLFHDGTNMGLATARTAPYLSSKKHVDPMRGGSSDEANFNSENGTRDAILMRLAETFLIRAEANGRKGNYALAVDDINVLRQRAAYKGGESRPAVLVEWEPGAATLTTGERTAPFPAAGSSFNAIRVSENHFTPGMPEAIAEQYIPTATTKEQMFIHFIYNEKAREFLSEGLAWEDQHNAGILYDRVIHLNQMASNLSGLWPAAANGGGGGQDGNGKGTYQPHYTFRPWPNAYLLLLTDEKGSPLDEESRAAYQNPGY